MPKQQPQQPERATLDWQPITDALITELVSEGEWTRRQLKQAQQARGLYNRREDLILFLELSEWERF